MYLYIYIYIYIYMGRGGGTGGAPALSKAIRRRRVLQVLRRPLGPRGPKAFRSEWF